MATKFKTDTCLHCGAWVGLHHADTQQCPYGGREAHISGEQLWHESTFEDSGIAKLNEAAPAMYKELIGTKHILEMLQSGYEQDNSEYQMIADCLKDIEAALAAANPETKS